MIRQILTALPPALLLAAPLHADISMTSTVSGGAMGKSMSGPSTIQIKGLKMRTEATVAGQSTVSILDVEARQMIVLDTKKQVAEVFDMTQLATVQQQIGMNDLQIDFKPTGDKREIAGFSCDGYHTEIRVKVDDPTGQGSQMQVVIGGPVWLAKDAPGKEEFANFYVAAAKAGLFFGNPELAKAQPGREKAMTELQRAMAETGLDCASELNIGFEGEGMMAAIMKKMNVTANSTLQSVSDAPLSDDLFKVPAGWKVKKK
ncbi:MAG: hypothetical protein HC897_14005 [Thermoanaerobaculia bacterium]|nr:hypothetical protein [Thermoanaerobaculia bacterium]